MQNDELENYRRHEGANNVHGRQILIHHNINFIVVNKIDKQQLLCKLVASEARS